MNRLNAKELRALEEDKTLKPIKRHPLYLVLDSIYDTYNIGGLFRLADALAAEKLLICGESETPPNHRIQKASIGTYKVTPWEYFPSAAEAIQSLQTEQPDIQVISVELTDTAIPFTDCTYTAPCALVLGNETFGVSEEAQKLSDHTVYIPMHGYNTSMNVIVSAAIVAEYVLRELQEK